jgi:pimeloyl-ACP methyl ester carboxylesterase
MALTEPDHWVGRLHEIDAPSLIIHGSDDIVIPHLRGQELERALPSARLLTLHGAGHELHHSDWPTIVDAITEHTQA